MIPNEYTGWTMMLIDRIGRTAQYQVKGNNEHGLIQVLLPNPEDEVSMLERLSDLETGLATLEAKVETLEKGGTSAGSPPEPMLICEKAGECDHGGCYHIKKHRHIAMCAKDKNAGTPCRWLEAHCIPYVPEDEERDWFVSHQSYSRVTKAQAMLYVKGDPAYRAFKWGDGAR
jgi:hypothetical protein